MSLIECIDLTIFCNFAQKTLAYKKTSLFVVILMKYFNSSLHLCNGMSSIAKLTKKDVFLELCILKLVICSAIFVYITRDIKNDLILNNNVLYVSDITGAFRRMPLRDKRSPPYDLHNLRCIISFR